MSQPPWETGLPDQTPAAHGDPNQQVASAGPSHVLGGVVLPNPGDPPLASSADARAAAGQPLFFAYRTASSGGSAHEDSPTAGMAGQQQQQQPHHHIPPAVAQIWGGFGTAPAAEPAAAASASQHLPLFPASWQLPILSGSPSASLQAHGGWPLPPLPAPHQRPSAGRPSGDTTSPSPLSPPPPLPQPSAAGEAPHASPPPSSHAPPAPSRQGAVRPPGGAAVTPTQQRALPGRPLPSSPSSSSSGGGGGGGGAASDSSRDTASLATPPSSQAPPGVTSARSHGRRPSRRAAAFNAAAQRLFTPPGGLPVDPGACSCRGGSNPGAECLRRGAVWWVMGGTAPLGPLCGARMRLLWEQGIVVVAASRVCGVQRLPPDGGAVPPPPARFQVLSRILAATLAGGAYAWAEPSFA